jgi:hypothetical protein
MEWYDDPISKTKLQDPVLTSDGVTYSKDSILMAMRADEWHRSPVTGEVLRPHAYANTLIKDLLREGNEEDEDADHVTVLWEPCDDAAPLPLNGGVITWTLPELCSSQVAAVKLKWRLDTLPHPLSLTVRVLRDAMGGEWCMHPPPAEEMWDDCLQLARAFNVHLSTLNPWCLTTAVFGHGVTVEQQWFGQWVAVGKK